MIFDRFQVQLLNQIDLILEYHLNDIQIEIKWSTNTNSIQWILPYLDDECTLPTSSPPLFYLCSSKTSSLNPSFYSYWFLLNSSFYHRLFSHLILDDDHFILLLALADGRILALPESPKDHQPIIWYTSLSTHPVFIIGFDYDLNTNLLDAVLSSTVNSKFPTRICNHLILCDYRGSLILINSLQLRRILLDHCIQSACIHSNHLIYLTKNEIRSISIANLVKPSNEDLITQTKILRLGHFDKLLVDGQEMILYYSNGTFERLNNLLPSHACNPSSRLHSLANQTKKLACLTTTIMNLQSQACLLQRILKKIEMFYQLNLIDCLKFIDDQWKLSFNEQQLRIFQPNDFLLILLCQFSSKKMRIYQLNSNNHWIFPLKDLVSMTGLCQPILLLRSQNQLHCRMGSKKILLSLQEHVHEDEISIENYFPTKFKSLPNNQLSRGQYHLALTLRNDAAMNFKNKLSGLTRRINQVTIECKQQEMKVDTDAGLVDALTIQIILSSSCLRRLILTFSALTELFYGNKILDEKNFIKQVDILKLMNLIENKLFHLSDEFFLHLLQIRIYLSMFRLGSNYTVQVY